MSSAKAGFLLGLPIFPNDATKFMRGDGTWAVPTAVAIIPMLACGSLLLFSYNVTRFFALGTISANTTQVETRHIFKPAGTFKHLYLTLTGNTLAGGDATSALRIVLQKNGVDTTLLLDVKVGDAAAPTAYSIAVDVAANGSTDDFNMKVYPVGTAMNAGTGIKFLAWLDFQ